MKNYLSLANDSRYISAKAKKWQLANLFLPFFLFLSGCLVDEPFTKKGNTEANGDLVGVWLWRGNDSITVYEVSKTSKNSLRIDTAEYKAGGKKVSPTTFQGFEYAHNSKKMLVLESYDEKTEGKWVYIPYKIVSSTISFNVLSLTGKPQKDEVLGKLEEVSSYPISLEKTKFNTLPDRLGGLVQTEFDKEAEDFFWKGRKLYEGNTGEEDSKKGAEFAKKAADMGHAKAQYLYGRMLQYGDGVDKNTEQAASWYSESVSNGFLGANVDLGLLYIYGTGVDQDLKKGKELIVQVASEGSGYANATLGDLLYWGDALDQNWEKAYQHYKIAADKGNAAGQYGQANMIESHGFDQGSFENFWDLYHRSAKGGNTDALVAIGLLYYNGKGVKRDYKEASKLYKEAADKGHLEGKSKLGYMYHKGLGVKQDFRRAFELYSDAAAQGDQSGLFNLGYFYAEAGDKKKALDFYTQAKDAGNEFAERAIKDLLAPPKPKMQWIVCWGCGGEGRRALTPLVKEVCPHCKGTGKTRR